MICNKQSESNSYATLNLVGTSGLDVNYQKFESRTIDS